MNMQAVAPARWGTASFGFAACCVAAALAVGWMAAGINRERACTLEESIAAGLCAPPPTPGSDAETQMLRSRIARNPGDADAYTALALADRSSRQDELVAVASQLAPREPNLLLRRAAAALDRKDWAHAVPALVELADQRGARPAAKSLAQLVALGHGALLEPYLTPGNHWLEDMLQQMRSADTPFSSALPLVIRALQLGVLDDETVRGYMRDLKARGAWADAYALWLSLHGKSLPALFNGSFDHAFELDGFDWELPAGGPARRVGVIAERRRVEGRGGVLELQFTSRAIQLPIVRQYLFIGPGHYRLAGSYMARQFRIENALQWTVRCGTRSVAASTSVSDTGGLWRPLDFAFTVPHDCGLVASLQLETASPADATLGARGRMSFDGFHLEKVAP
jgi:hypothetical protein